MYQRTNRIYSDIKQQAIEHQTLQQFKLKQNYPNPFNSSTIINYEISQANFITLEIYNLLGHKLRTLVAEFRLVGDYYVYWDGTNYKGILVPTGLYIYRTKIQDKIQKQ